MNGINFILSNTAPNPTICKYWIDTTENPYGGVIKFYDGTKWDYLNNTNSQETSIDAIVKGITDNYINSVNANGNELVLSKIQTNYTLENGVLKPSTTSSQITLPNVTTSKAGVMSSADKAALDKLVADYAALEARVAALEAPAA